MKHLTLLFLIVIISHVYVLSQDSSTIASKYEVRTIYPYGNKYVLNGQSIKQNQLGNYLSKVSGSASDFRLYKKYSSKSWRYAILALALHAGGLTQIDTNNTLAYVLMGGGVILHFAATLPLSIKAKKHLQKSIWLYNKTVLQ